MESLLALSELFIWFVPLLIVVILWETVWKLIALWRAGRNNELAWFICIALINTAGILPIIYLLIDRNRKKVLE